MTDDRRYSRDEIQRIFETASRSEEARRSDLERSGMTIAELREIADEVGIPAERVEAAALELDRKPESGDVAAARSPTPPTGAHAPPTGHFSVRYVAPLPRPLSETEWTALVADLRDTFEATGRVREEAGLREWRNGNLRVAVEPTPEGWRMRMASTGSRMRALATAGAVVTFTAAMGLVTSHDPGSVPMIGGGVALLGWSQYRLRGWARLRRAQMETLASRWAAALTAPPAEARDAERG